MAMFAHILIWLIVESTQINRYLLVDRLMTVFFVGCFAFDIVSTVKFLTENRYAFPTYIELGVLSVIHYSVYAVLFMIHLLYKHNQNE